MNVQRAVSLLRYESSLTDIIQTAFSHTHHNKFDHLRVLAQQWQSRAGDGGSVCERLVPGTRLRTLVQVCPVQWKRVVGPVRGSSAQ